MSLVFKTIQTEGIAELSYLLGDDDEGVAAVFDPRPDVEVYVDLAREAKVSITHIFETHIHADLMSGSRELCARTAHQIGMNVRLKNVGDGNLRLARQVDVNLDVRPRIKHCGDAFVIITEQIGKFRDAFGLN